MLGTKPVIRSYLVKSCGGHIGQWVASVVLLLTTPLAPAQRLPLPPQEQQAVNQAIDRGVAYLKRTQLKNGTWPRSTEKRNPLRGHFLLQSYQAGYAALPALTLLECGVPSNDPAIQQAAHFIRSRVAKMDLTYELSLSTLFLDRLSDPKDKSIIQTLALRLIAGQSTTGGWGYRCPLLSGPAQMELLTALRHLDPPSQNRPGLAGQPIRKPDAMVPIAQAPGTGLVEGQSARSPASSLSGSLSRDNRTEASSLAHEVAGDTAEALTSLRNSGADPSDQWRDCLGWTILDKRDHKILKREWEGPARSGLLPAKRQAQANEGKASDANAKSAKPYVLPKRIAYLPVVQDADLLWMQDPPNNPTDPLLPTTDNSNTQFAILALWRAQQYDVPMKRSLNLIVRRFLTSQNADGTWGYHYRFGGGEESRKLTMTCVGLIGLAVGYGLAHPKAGGQPVQDPRIINGLFSLSMNVGQPVDGPAPLSMQNLYFLWSLERVAVLYNLPLIGDKDWYRWGAQILVRNQEAEGCWSNGLYIGSSPPLDTCLALLFLKRTNLVKDLTARLPFSAADLNSSIIAKQTPLSKPTPTPKQIKQLLPPAETPQPAELDKPLVKTSLSSESTEETAGELANAQSSRRKNLILLSVIFFLIFSGGSLVFILFAIHQHRGTAREEKPGKHGKRSLNCASNADRKRRTSCRSKHSPSG